MSVHDLPGAVISRRMLAERIARHNGLGELTPPDEPSEDDPYAEVAPEEVSPQLSPQQTLSDQRKRATGDSGDRGDSGVRRRTSWTAAELLAMDFPDPRWAVPDVVPEGLTLLAGPPKIGKSWLSLGLVVATATGGKALGRIDVDQGSALYLALEDTPRRLKSRLEKVTAGTDPAQLSALTIATECPRLPAGGDACIAGWLDKHPDARLVVIDVLSKVRGIASRDVSQYDADYAAISRIKAIADTYSVAVVVVHHTRKMAASDFLDEVSGTQGIAGAADAIIALKRARASADGILSVTGRDVEDAQHPLIFAAEIGAWQLSDKPVAEIGMQDTRLAVLHHVRDHPGARPKQITDALGVDHNLIKQTCARMVKDGQLDTDGKGNYHVPVTVVTAVTPAGQSVISGDSCGDTPEEVASAQPDAEPTCPRCRYPAERLVPPDGLCKACAYPAGGAPDDDTDEPEES